eukprot:434593_1
MKAAIKHYLLSPNTQTNNNTQQQSPNNNTNNNTTSEVVSTQDILSMNPTDDLNNNTTDINNTNDENKENKDEEYDEIPSTYDVQKLQTAMSIVINHDDVTVFTDELADSIQYIWKHEKKIQKAFQNHEINEKILHETTEYFWTEINRIKQSDYVPNEEDIIRVRSRTTGVIEKRFEINNTKFHIFDVGGQKSERKKWMNCFYEVKAVIFVVSLSCFNEMMYEDLNKNRMVDAMELFDKTINSKYFTDTHIILLLNDRDLFRKKITKIPITVCSAFEDFSSYRPQTNETIINPNDYEQTTSFIKFKFEILNKSFKRKQ